MNVLFVQEEPFLPVALQLMLRKHGYNLITLHDKPEAPQTFDRTNPGIIIANIAENGGIAYLIEAKKRNVPVIVVSSNGGEAMLDKAFALGADDYVSTPICLTELALRVDLLARSAVSSD